MLRLGGDPTLAAMCSAAALWGTLQQANTVLSRFAPGSSDPVHCNCWVRSARDGRPAARLGDGEGREETLQGNELCKEKHPRIFCFSVMFCTDSRSWEKTGSISEQRVIRTSSRGASRQLGLILTRCNRGDRAEHSEPPKDTVQAPLLIKSQKSSGCARAAARFPAAVLYSQRHRRQPVRRAAAPMARVQPRVITALLLHAANYTLPEGHGERAALSGIAQTHMLPYGGASPR